jgi:hypothetical protein
MQIVTQIRDLRDGYKAIDTNMLDNLWDCIRVYANKDIITDGGYFDYQLSCANYENAQERRDILDRAAGYFGCQVSDENEIYCQNANSNDALTCVLQSCTAVSTIILEAVNK